MSSSPVAELIEFYLPVLVEAGDYALRIQAQIAGPAQKSGLNAWTQALTVFEDFHPVRSTDMLVSPGPGIHAEILRLLEE